MIRRCAPSATATLTGVLLEIAPSARYRRSNFTGANAGGIAALARMAAAAGPFDKHHSFAGPNISRDDVDRDFCIVLRPGFETSGWAYSGGQL
jgi:hypothetical protein